MTKNRLNLVIALALSLVLLVGGYFLGVQPQLGAASTNRAQQRSIESTNETYRAELNRLAGQAAKLPEMRTEATALGKSVPSGADTANFYKEVSAIASAASVTVSNITTSYATAYAPPEAADGATGATTQASPSASASASPEPAASAAPTVALPATDARITSANFSTIAVSIDVTGSFEQALAFTKGVQNGERLFLVNDITSAKASTASGDTTGADTSSATSWTLSGYVYVLSDADPTATDKG